MGTSAICKKSADCTESRFVSISKWFPLVVKRILPPVMDSPGKVWILLFHQSQYGLIHMPLFEDQFLHAIEFSWVSRLQIQYMTSLALYEFLFRGRTLHSSKFQHSTFLSIRPPASLTHWVIRVSKHPAQCPQVPLPQTQYNLTSFRSM